MFDIFPFYLLSFILKRKGRGTGVTDILAKRLKQCRMEKGLTQREVAIYCDITEKTYQNYELMTREPKLDILRRLADVYQVSIDYLVGRTDQKDMNR